MKITATDLVGALGTVTLGDDTTTASGFTGPDVIDPAPWPVQKRSGQIEQLAFGAAVFAAGRGNAQTSFSWTVLRNHDTQTHAATFQLSHANAVPIQCSIQIFDDAGTEHQWQTALITEVAVVDWTNVVTKIRYSVEAAQPNPTEE